MLFIITTTKKSANSMLFIITTTKKSANQPGGRANVFFFFFSFSLSFTYRVRIVYVHDNVDDRASCLVPQRFRLVASAEVDAALPRGPTLIRLLFQILFQTLAGTYQCRIILKTVHCLLSPRNPPKNAQEPATTRMLQPRSSMLSRVSSLVLHFGTGRRWKMPGAAG
jgi:hypothetical protein